MDWSILLSMAGIIVSILVGLITFYIADRRSQRRRWQQAKQTILMELSKSLGEDTVPNLEIISATTRSVLRDYDAKALDAIPFDEIIDDLIRQITSDPFLGSERRRQLQDQMLGVKNGQPRIKKMGDAWREARAERGAMLGSAKSVLGSILVGAVASMVTMIIFRNLETISEFLRRSLEGGRIIELILPFLVSTITTFLSIFFLVYSLYKRKKGI